MDIKKGYNVLNVPCGTGINLSYFEEYLEGSGKVFGVDLSDGMIVKAKKLIRKRQYHNTEIIKKDVTSLDDTWRRTLLSDIKFDAILCDLGLSGFPIWEEVINNLFSMLEIGGKLVIMDFYIKKDTIRSKYIRFFGKGETNRPIPEYVLSVFDHVSTNQSFKNGDMFVITITKN
jgi:ubiquinone/menaquinone biosynthesis C-methylase UbiE